MIHYFYGTLQVGIGQTLCSFEHVSCWLRNCSHNSSCCCCCCCCCCCSSCCSRWDDLFKKFSPDGEPESDFRFDVRVSRWRPWRHFTQKVLPPGGGLAAQCTHSVCPAHMQQRPPVINLSVVLSYLF